jgi:hypothetical protein
MNIHGQTYINDYETSANVLATGQEPLQDLEIAWQWLVQCPFREHFSERGAGDDFTVFGFAAGCHHK